MIQARKRHIKMNLFPGLSLGETHVFTLFYTVEARFIPFVPGTNQGRRAAEKAHVLRVYVPFSLANDKYDIFSCCPLFAVPFRRRFTKAKTCTMLAAFGAFVSASIHFGGAAGLLLLRSVSGGDKTLTLITSAHRAPHTSNHVKMAHPQDPAD